jgi:hypothetical protein
VSVYLKVPDSWHEAKNMDNGGLGQWIKDVAMVSKGPITAAMNPIRPEHLEDDPCVTYKRDPLADPEVSTRAAIVKYILDAGLVLRASSNEDLLMLASWVELGTEKLREVSTEGNTNV